MRTCHFIGPLATKVSSTMNAPKEILNLGKVLDGAHEEGAHAWYQNLGQEIGIKIFKNSSVALREYLITKYLQSSGLTTTALCLILVRFVSPDTGRILQRPAIVMEHINGPKVQDVIDTIIYHHCPLELITKSLGTKEKWAYESEQFQSVRSQLERSILTIQNSFSIKCSDHCENMNNIILQPNGLIKIIDFSAEVIPVQLRKVINKQSDAWLATKLPIDILHLIEGRY